MNAKIYWPESQQCVGCKHGCFLIKEPESSVYICEKGLVSPEKGCSEPDVSNVEDLDLEILQEMEESFEERLQKNLFINLEDFQTLKTELEKRRRN